MKNTFGTNITYTLFGESHGEAVGIVIDGLPAGILINQKFIAEQMDKRKAVGKISTQRHEADKVEIISGLFEGHTTGTPLTMLIKNTAQHSNDYQSLRYRVRPGHADYTAHVKYHGNQDYRGGGHFSGRLTAPIVAAGAVAMQLLQTMNIDMGTHILQCHQIKDNSFSDNKTTLKDQIQRLKETEFPVLEPAIGKDMIQFIEKTARMKDSVGGVLETAVINVPAGLGEPFFNSMESTLSQLLFSIPGVKGVSFGSGTAFADHYGSEMNDSFIYEEGVKTATNHNGGINGGITNGMPLRFTTIIKPTPSIYKPQNTIDLETNKEVSLTIQGRHDPTIIHRARIVVDAVTAIGILEAMTCSQAIEPFYS
ncbi:MAG: chorismate synthase [Erysipelotrichaceae bacterium]|nr:chorismate synthase [Erysipelotrichaceae bacterium]